MNEDGQTSSIKDKILTVDVQPGWKQGTRITFEKEGDQVMPEVWSSGPGFQVSLCVLCRSPGAMGSWERG